MMSPSMTVFELFVEKYSPDFCEYPYELDRVAFCGHVPCDDCCFWKRCTDITTGVPTLTLEEFAHVKSEHPELFI